VRAWRDPLFLRISVPVVQGPRTFVALRRLIHDHGLLGKTTLDGANGVMLLYAEGVHEKTALDLVKDIQNLVPAGHGYVAPILVHRRLLQSWGARVEPSLHQLAFQPLKERIDPTGVFSPIL
jgi:hypothetical protein